jgi:hypothetical protein
MCYGFPMNTPHPYMRLGVFLAGLLAVFAAAAAIGSAFEPAETEDGMEETMGAHATESHGGHEAEQVPAGLGISGGGYTLRLGSDQFERGEAGQLRFAIEDADGHAVTGFDELHERRMHLIVVRRDGAEFRHLHPEMDAAGTWTVPVEFDAPGVYRAFADFSAEGQQETLAADVFVSGGAFTAQPFPASSPVDRSAGYEVRLQTDELRAGEHSQLTFAVRRGGEEVADLAPYLGAKGHLVALREGDLAFLHVHPEEEQGEANEIVFNASFPTAGRYRLYLQFRHEGAVRTVEYTVEVPG